MRHVHSIRFEPLEARKLLSAAKVAAAHPAPAGPVALVGTLSVDARDATATMNPDGSTTTSMAVAGQLDALGKVRGVWNEKTDAFGDVLAPDVLRLRDPKGTIVVTFNNQTPGAAHKLGRNVIFHPHAQRIFSGTGAYAGATETGTVQIVSNATETVVKSLVLNSKAT